MPKKPVFDRVAALSLSLLLTGCEDLGDLADKLGIDFNGIAQVVPPDGSERVPLRSPVVIFADDKYSDVPFSAEVEDASGELTDISAELRVEKKVSGADKDIYVLTTAEGWPASSTVRIGAGGEIDREVSFGTAADGGLFDTPTDLSFDSADSPDLPPGWRGFGDYGAIGERGDLAPTSGAKQLALSSGDAVSRSAVGDTSTMVVSDPLDAAGAGSVRFDYTFLSSELDAYCDSDFDDTMMAIASGPDGARAKVVDSVNLICADERQRNADFPGLPDDGADQFRGTRSAEDSIDLSEVGSPFSVTFLVTDVGDAILTTVVGVDSVRVD